MLGLKSIHVSKRGYWLSTDNMQGRIQDLKLGVAQTDWKILKTGGGGGGGIVQINSRYDYIFIV